MKTAPAIRYARTTNRMTPIDASSIEPPAFYRAMLAGRRRAKVLTAQEVFRRECSLAAMSQEVKQGSF
jgi:hypothetical protein